MGGAQWGNKQSANTSLALFQTDTTKQMLAVSGGVLNSVYPCINFTSHGDNEQVRFFARDLIMSMLGSLTIINMNIIIIKS